MALTAGAARGGEETFYIGHHAKFVNITFESNADVETIVGTTMTAKGEVTVDAEKGMGSVSVTVPVASLKTGIDMRDEHLRGDKWLDAAKFADITFVSKKSAPVKDKKNQIEVTGDFTLHGVTKSMTIVVDWKEIAAETAKKAQFPDGKWMKFSTSFDVKLSDFGVKVPEGAGAKVSDTWKVSMSIFAGPKMK
jgi:polyisoprenoid-binding protein YceI